MAPKQLRLDGLWGSGGEKTSDKEIQRKVVLASVDEVQINKEEQHAEEIRVVGGEYIPKGPCFV